MQTLKKVTVVFLLLLFIALVALLVKVYFDVKSAEEYVEFITNSSNDLIVEVDQINLSLNELQYDESEQDLKELQSKLSEIDTMLEDVKTKKRSYKIPYQGEEIDRNFNDFVAEVEKLANAFEGIIESVENLDEKEIFEGKIEEYGEYSNEIQAKSSILEESLTQYVQDYTKLDFNRIIDGISFI